MLTRTLLLRRGEIYEEIRSFRDRLLSSTDLTNHTKETPLQKGPTQFTLSSISRSTLGAMRRGRGGGRRNG